MNKKFTVAFRQVHHLPVEAFNEDEALAKAKVILSYGFSSEAPEVLSVKEWTPYTPKTEHDMNGVRIEEK